MNKITIVDDLCVYPCFISNSDTEKDHSNAPCLLHII